MNIVTAPALDIDALMLTRYDRKVSTNGRLERRIVANLIAHLQAAGFEPVSVYDGEDTTLAQDAKEAMECVFSVDQAWIHFSRPRNKLRHGVFLVVGNGTDIVSDSTVSSRDPGFDVAVDTFLDRIDDLTEAQA